MTSLLPHAPDNVDEADLLDLLSAYQYLQAQSLRMSTRISEVLDLSPTDVRALVYLLRAQDPTPKDLATFLHHTTGSITAMVDRLERSGHLSRRPHPSDRRSQTLHLTDTGIKAVGYIRTTYQDAFNGAFVGPAIQTAASTLKTLADALTPALSEISPA
ncbi:MarR family winged helix-turn-helix transcriptional regulator [Frondihabitans peucedani]|uniref:MarR family transcriptional regulator n=1 Tax=Frondihabitans peucedani TaxID=598626 RepID=A0ABP8E3G0_9MICO